jgi:putative SOS response-associated peptidase YedK
MCGRVIQKSRPDLLGLHIVDDLSDPRVKSGNGHRWSNAPPRYNGAPSQDLWVIRRHPTTGERSLDLLRWGLIPHFCVTKPKPPPINAPAESLTKNELFRDAYRHRRCIMPIDGFFEWRAVEGREDQAALRHRHEERCAVRPRWPVGELEGSGHRRMAAHVLHRDDARQLARAADPQPHAADPESRRLRRWLSDEDDPRDLLQPHPSEPMTMWPVSTRVNSPKNDDPSLIEPLTEADSSWPRDGNSA